MHRGVSNLGDITMVRESLLGSESDLTAWYGTIKTPEGSEFGLKRGHERCVEQREKSTDRSTTYARVQNHMHGGTNKTVSSKSCSRQRDLYYGWLADEREL